LRENTERPETLEANVNILAGTKSETILTAAKEMLSSQKTWHNPFGDGTAGEKIVEFIVYLSEKNKI
jgi:UDP-N-acetylglucosamine 2-epimerase (non-hydrolysing)